MAGEHVPFRMDFEHQIVSFDEETRTVQFVVRPDSRRYDEAKDDQGRTIYRDKFFDVIIGPDVLRDLARQAVGLPAYYVPPNIDSAVDYTQERAAAVTTEIHTGEHVPPSTTPDRHRPLGAGETERWVCFISVDIVGSTRLRKADAAKFDEAYRLFIQEVGTAAGQFHAHILKLTGDGVILYMDLESTNNQCDNTIDLALTIVRLTSQGINPALEAAGLPRLEIRVGADYGSALMRTFSVPATGFTGTDASSDALNRAVKIQESCEPGEVRIGFDLYQGVHVGWLMRSERIGEIGQQVGDGEYLTYRVS